MKRLEVVAWEHELGYGLKDDGTYAMWSTTPKLSRTLPKVPRARVRNLQGLVRRADVEEYVQERIRQALNAK